MIMKISKGGRANDRVSMFSLFGVDAVKDPSFVVVVGFFGTQL